MSSKKKPLTDGWNKEKEGVEEKGRGIEENAGVSFDQLPKPLGNSRVEHAAGFILRLPCCGKDRCFAANLKVESRAVYRFRRPA